MYDAHPEHRYRSPSSPMWQGGRVGGGGVPICADAASRFTLGVYMHILFGILYPHARPTRIPFRRFHGVTVYSIARNDSENITMKNEKRRQKVRGHFA